MAVYFAILEIANNKDAITALMGHLVAPAFTRYSLERTSQGMQLELSTMAVEHPILGQPMSTNSR